MSDSAVEQLIERHKAAFVAGDVDGLMADYADDAVMVMKGAPPMEGAAAIRATYEMIFAQLFPPADTKVEFEPAIYAGDLVLVPFSATTSAVKTVAGQDSFVVRGGRIVGQFGGGEVVPLAG